MLHDCCAALLGKERCNEEAKWSLRAAADSAAAAEERCMLHQDE